MPSIKLTSTRTFSTVVEKWEDTWEPAAKQDVISEQALLMHKTQATRTQLLDKILNWFSLEYMTLFLGPAAVYCTYQRPFTAVNK